MYEVVLPRRVRKVMNRFPQRDFERVLAAIKDLADDPRPGPPREARKMRGTGQAEEWRISVGRDYRVVYQVEEPHPDQGQGQELGEGGPAGLVTVLAVGHRQGIYG